MGHTSYRKQANLTVQNESELVPVSLSNRFVFAKRYWLLVLLLVGLLLRVFVAMRAPNMYWADEVFQTQEPGHRLAYGYGVITWEFRRGVRSWIFPAFLAGIMRATDWMGRGSSGYLLGIAIILSAISLTTIWFGFAWAKRAGGADASVIAVVACATWFELIYFAPKALNEVLAAHILLPGLYLGVYAEKPGEKIRLFLAGLLCGFAMALRIQLAASSGLCGRLLLLS